jgi:zinc protease
MRATLPLIAALAASCAPKGAPPPPAVSLVRPFPAPLAPRDVALPPSTPARIGAIDALIVPSSETPLVTVQVVFKGGASADPAGKEGLASAVRDMLTEGAGSRDAVAIQRTAKSLGVTFLGGVGTDALSFGVQGPTSSLEPMLDLLADILRRPTFPAAKWEVSQARRRAALDQSLRNPVSVAYRVAGSLRWGDAYAGRNVTDESLAAIAQKDLVAWHKATLHPGNALLLVGGDVEPAAITASLERRFGDWKAGTPAPAANPGAFAAAPGTLYLVDAPGSAQSVLVSLLPAPDQTDDDWYATFVGNHVLGGSFTSRVNMNLREDKGYTYGARCSLFDGAAGPGTWRCLTSVASDVTVPALTEIMAEVRDVVGDEPLTDEEVAVFKDNLTGSFVGGFETPSDLLGTLAGLWVDALPASRLEAYVGSVSAITPDAARAALARHLRPDEVAWLVVGDAAAHAEGLSALGLPVIRLDRDGRPLETP